MTKNQLVKLFVRLHIIRNLFRRKYIQRQDLLYLSSILSNFTKPVKKFFLFIYNITILENPDILQMHNSCYRASVQNILGFVNPGPSAHWDKSGCRYKRIQNRHANTALLVLRGHVYPLLYVRMPANIYAFSSIRLRLHKPQHGHFPAAARMHKASGHAHVFTFVDFETHMFLSGTIPASLIRTLHSNLIY